MTWKWPLYLAAFALIPVLGACEPGETPEQDRQDGPGAATRSAPVAFMPNDHSGVTGTALTDQSDGRVTITVSLEGLDPATTYLASAHSDRCAADGPVRVPLGRITGNDEGTARADFRAEVEELPEHQPWSIQIQTENGETVACADIVGL
jgi:hypothetical protein